MLHKFFPYGRTLHTKSCISLGPAGAFFFPCDDVLNSNIFQILWTNQALFQTLID